MAYGTASASITIQAEMKESRKPMQNMQMIWKSGWTEQK